MSARWSRSWSRSGCSSRRWPTRARWWRARPGCCTRSTRWWGWWRRTGGSSSARGRTSSPSSRSRPLRPCSCWSAASSTSGGRSAASPTSSERRGAMAQFAINAAGLGKDYVVGVRRGYKTLREGLTSAAGAPLRLFTRRGPAPSEEHVLRALDDLTFTVEEGQTVGFVGHNGAGKSTLLKVLSRITEPTRGRVDVRGRIGSLLEVGTGFHPELTGRENIYLNGAVLGMSRQEITRRFDDIVAFADVERFLETPVKRYSSGMYVRLAFSVATHLEPEVLIVDEVLSVGDAAFQRRSLSRMAEVAKQGRTVLFVSHNLAVVQALCERAIVLDRGRVIADGPTEAAVADYLRTLEQAATGDLLVRTDRAGRGAVLVESVAVSGGRSGVLCSGAPLVVDVAVTGVLRDATCSITIVNALGQPVATLDSGREGPEDRFVDDPRRFRCAVPALPLVPGRYRLDVTLTGDGYEQDSIPAAAVFDVEQGLLDGRPVTGDASGDVAVRHSWHVPGTVQSAGGE